MAGTKITTDITELTKQRKGKNAITLDSYIDGVEPVAYGELEIAGSLYSFSAEDLDVAGNFLGIGNDTIFYCYVEPTTIVPYISIVAPTWDIDKNGYYLASAPTNRCFMQSFKDSAGNWDQKALLFEKNSKISNLISWHSLDGAADVQLFAYIGAATSSDFTIKKPISCVITTTATQYAIQLKYSGGYITLFQTNTTPYAELLNPGTYRISVLAGTGTTTLYAVGVYGADTVTASEIVA